MQTKISARFVTHGVKALAEFFVCMLYPVDYVCYKAVARSLFRPLNLTPIGYSLTNPLSTRHISSYRDPLK